MNEPKTIDCEEALRRLAEYLDGELEPGSGREVEKHLQRCRSCYSRSEFEMRLKRQLAELGSEPVSPAFEERIRAMIGHFLCL